MVRSNDPVPEDPAGEIGREGSHAAVRDRFVLIRSHTGDDASPGFDEGESGFRLYGIPRCAVHASRDVNMRDGAGTNFDAVEVLAADALGFVDGQTSGEDGLIWWHLTNGLYFREDTVDELGTVCAGVTEM